jgi:hypothetical protein
MGQLYCQRVFTASLVEEYNQLMREVLDATKYDFPYTELHFPGMNSGERILFVTRESDIMQRIRFGTLIVMDSAVLFLGLLLVGLGSQYVSWLSIIRFPLFVLVAIVALVGYWWIRETHRKSVFIITNRRLTKIIYTTPFTWYQFSLGLDEIEDTGSYSSSYFEAMFGLGYFVARSGAAAIKNFKIVNITFAADLHNYVNKLLYAFKHHQQEIAQFRPFIPHMKGEARKNFLEKYPEYKTEF